MTCTRKFSTPKKRKCHLIDLHKYPKEVRTNKITFIELAADAYVKFFFALPKYGLEQLYIRFGDSASLVAPSRRRQDVSFQQREEAPLAFASQFAQNARMKGFRSQQDNPSSRAPHTQSSLEATSRSPTDQSSLVSQLEKLSFVPSSVKFGRRKSVKLGRHTSSEDRPPVSRKDRLQSRAE